MAEEKSAESGSIFSNPSALLALLTIVGGLWLVSQKLVSDRPVTPAGGSKEFVGDQKLESRLWEDPFKSVATEDRAEAGSGDSKASSDLDVLLEQITRKTDPATPEKPILLLPVMLSGGQYSEDQESRIRSRYAIVSALGQSGYVPEDAEHIGTVKIPWLTDREVAGAKKPGAASFAKLWEKDRKIDAASTIRLLGITTTTRSPKMELRYEWYRPRVFSQGSGLAGGRNVLVLWLDETYFEEDPLLRLPLLLEPLADAARYPPGFEGSQVALVGPRRSSTLGNMLPKWQANPQSREDTQNANLTNVARKVLERIDIFCATPSAMDEVLVKDPSLPDVMPRTSVREKLKGEGFHSFHNFAATDAQMAREILDELTLRGLRLGENGDHVVLISEWDTFYARMLSLTYGAELAVRQKSASSRAQFINRYISSANPENLPRNFHPFVYLRGLDGQTVGGETGGAKETTADSARSDKSIPTSIEDLRHWMPDVNKAEGQAQFDYLGRLGDRVNELQKNLRRADEGEIRAIGIVGSDVYDTLLILQALRQRFPQVLFFTTDLDVRFFHPGERDWARNLIVASSYGLALNSDLQGTVAPFRDSTQTAQFAATLAALGNPYLAGIARIPPRRFEVGNRAAADLSVASVVLGSPHPATDSILHPWLHPLTASEKDHWHPDHDFHRLWWSILAIVLLLAGAGWLWDPVRRFTREGLEYPRKALDYSEEDLGGPDALDSVLNWLDGKKAAHELARWLVERDRVRELRQELKPLDEKLTQIGTEIGNLAAEHSADKKKSLETERTEVTWKREKIRGDLIAMLLTMVNQFLRQEGKCHPPKRLPVIQSDTGTVMVWVKSLLRRVPGPREAIAHYEARRSLDAFFNEMDALPPVDPNSSLPPVAPKGNSANLRERALQHLRTACPELYRSVDLLLGDQTAASPTGENRVENDDARALDAAHSARASAQSIYRLRCRQLVFFWGGAIGFGLAGFGLASIIWCDTFKRAEGEPFSLTSGASAWPAEVIRLFVFTLAVCFSFGLAHRMRETFLTMTRGFRFSLRPDVAPESTERVCAQSIWNRYGKNSRFKERLLPTAVTIFLYLVLVIAISRAFDEFIFSPLRGNVNYILDLVLLALSLLGFLLLAFLTVDAAILCRGFIEELSDRPTLYPETTRQYFSRQMGGIGDEYLDEWIDLQLIAELTERVGRLVYYPAGLIFLLVVARNSWWDCWSWPISLVVVFGLNFVVALACVVILQNAAGEAKRRAEESLSAKVNRLQALAAPSAVRNNRDQAEKLLHDIRHLRRGAFVPFWKNPVVGALFLSSGGTTMLQVFIWFMGR